MKPDGFIKSMRDPRRISRQNRRLDATFHALADPTRRAILGRLASGEASVMELAAPFKMTQPAVSKHLKVLERAGLIARSRDAQRRPCRIEPAPLKEATDWIGQYHALWEQRFDQLDSLLKEMQARDSGRDDRAMPHGMND